MFSSINVDYFYQEVCDSDYEFMLQTINAFEEYSFKILSSLREKSECSSTTRDNTGAIRLIHMFCGSIGLLGFTEQANVLTQIENRLREGEYDYDETRHNEVCKMIREINGRLDEYLAIIRQGKR
ncbi:hypothetical protein KUV89_01155 [Marinobacter hydrocarbonoclasticus]|nr:hypothetical protein [Marinobacter nauticus]